jgi:heme exporter protein D
VSYRDYVIAAYCVFAVVLAWDFIAPRVAIRQQLRAARLRVARASATDDSSGMPFSRDSRNP